MSLAPPIGVALLSFAHTHQEHWAKALTADPRAVVRAVWDADPGRGTAAAARHATTFEGSLDAVLRRPDVQAVTICTETCRHADLVVAAAQAGKHILCEKPIARISLRVPPDGLCGCRERRDLHAVLPATPASGQSPREDPPARSGHRAHQSRPQATRPLFRSARSGLRRCRGFWIRRRPGAAAFLDEGCPSDRHASLALGRPLRSGGPAGTDFRR